jgi:adenylate kinase family enzyme
MEFKNILLIGTTGVGKSTLANNIAMQYGDSNTFYRHIESGKIVKSFSKDSDYEDFAKGKLFQNERFLRWQLLNHINEIQMYSDTHIVLDGFPRTQDQLLFTIYSCIPISLAIYIDVDFEVIKDRIINRSRDVIDTVEVAMNRTINEKTDLLNLYSFAARMGIETLWIDATSMSEEELFKTVSLEMKKHGC